MIHFLAFAAACLLYEYNLREVAKEEIKKAEAKKGGDK